MKVNGVDVFKPQTGEVVSDGADGIAWGRRYLVRFAHRDAKPCVVLDHKRATLTVRPGSNAAKRAEVIHEWHKALLHEAVPPLIRKWERSSRSKCAVISYSG